MRKILYYIESISRELLNSWPGAYCNQSVSPLDGPCTKLPMTSNPLSGCSLTPSCGIQASKRSASKEVRDERVTFRNLFIQAFGQSTPENIAGQRQSGSSCLLFPDNRSVNKIVSSFMTGALISLFRD